MSKYPGINTLVKNFVNASARIIASGFEVVSKEEYENRLNICHNCPSLDTKEKRCMECGCWVEKKSAFSAEHCPLKKW